MSLFNEISEMKISKKNVVFIIILLLFIIPRMTTCMSEVSEKNRHLRNLERKLERNRFNVENGIKIYPIAIDKDSSFYVHYDRWSYENKIVIEHKKKTNTFSVYLEEKPEKNVVIPIQSEVLLSPTAIVFTPENYSDEQIVKITNTVKEDLWSYPEINSSLEVGTKNPNGLSNDIVHFYINLGPSKSEDPDFNNLQSIVEVSAPESRFPTVSFSGQKQVVLSASDGRTHKFNISASLPRRISGDIKVNLVNKNPAAGSLSVDEIFLTHENSYESPEIIFTAEDSDVPSTTIIELNSFSNYEEYNGAKKDYISIINCGKLQHNNGVGVCSSINTCAPHYENKNGICVAQISFVKIPEGVFTSDKGREIKINEFQITRTPITVEQFKTFTESISNTDNLSYRSYKREQGCNFGSTLFNHPMNCISVQTAEKFCEYIGGRLPTDNEWDYAATHNGLKWLNTKFPWGNDMISSVHANWGGNVHGTSSVGRYSPRGDSPLGIQDLIGNISEWTSSDGSHLSRFSSKIIKGTCYVNLYSDNECYGLSDFSSYSANDSPKIGFRCVK